MQKGTGGVGHTQTRPQNANVRTSTEFAWTEKRPANKAMRKDAAVGWSNRRVGDGREKGMEANVPTPELRDVRLKLGWENSQAGAQQKPLGRRGGEEAGDDKETKENEQWESLRIR